jgi:hypothetical protein
VSTVKRGEKLIRPTWKYEAEKRGEVVSTLDVLEMLESVRNVLEEVRDRLPLRRRKKAASQDEEKSA